MKKKSPTAIGIINWPINRLTSRSAARSGGWFNVVKEVFYELNYVICLIKLIISSEKPTFLDYLVALLNSTNVQSQLFERIPILEGSISSNIDPLYRPVAYSTSPDFLNEY